MGNCERIVVKWVKGADERKNLKNLYQSKLKI